MDVKRPSTTPGWVPDGQVKTQPALCPTRGASRSRATPIDPCILPVRTNFLQNLHLCTPLRDLSQRNQPRVPLLPILIHQAQGHKLARNRQDRVPPQANRQPVQALHSDVIVILVSSHIFFRVSRVPLWVVFNREEEVQEHRKEAANEVRELAHHAGGLVPGFGEGDQELDGQVAGAVLQLRGLQVLD